MDAGFNKALKKLVDDIFACFLHEDYENNLYLYEHRIHNSKTRCLSFIQKHAKGDDVSLMLGIYNGLMDCALLRWRVKDKSVFQICHNEMLAIKDALIAALLSSEPESSRALSASITALESLNQSVLQVAAKEPLAFILFVYSLKTLKENYFAIYSTASA